MGELKQLDNFCDRCSSIFIYGTGKTGNNVYSYLNIRDNSKVAGFIVSDGFAGSVSGVEKEVFCLSEVVPEMQTGVIVAIQNIPFNVKQKCFEIFGHNILFMYSELQSELQDWKQKWLSRRFNDHQKDYILETEETGRDPACIYLKNIFMERNIFRIYELEDQKQFQSIRNNCNLEEFRKEYGELKLVAYNGGQSCYDEKRNVEIYIVTSHLDHMNPALQKENVYRRVIQVGAELTSVRKNCFADNLGNHISLKNKEYCECTGLYWIWKNTKGQDYVGLEHYRRRMAINDSVIDELHHKQIDAVLPIPQYGITTNLEFMKKSLVTENDWELIKDIIVKTDKSYTEIVKQYEEGFFYFSCNIGLYKRAVFDEYCSFAFSIAEQLEHYYEQHNIVRKGDRYMGYIFEHLHSVFIMKNYGRFKIYCTDLLWCG